MINESSQYLAMDLLRLTTAGSVDDGKSTLIGRLLYDSKSIFEDQLESIQKSSQQYGNEHINLALLTDGLRAEREQGITIDVAYRYFATPKRKFIIADTPGHIQYTRNMVTGASTANLAMVLVDARNGVNEQTRRHASISSLLRLPHLILCINKMDLVNYEEQAFEKIKKEFEDFADRLDIPDIHYIPISAFYGDNVVDKSKNMPWYRGNTLLHTLENVHISNDYNHNDSRLAIQYVIRPHSHEYHDYRGYAGRVSGGIFHPGDEVIALPSGLSTQIKSIDTMSGSIDEAFAPMCVTLTLEDDIDISRGDMLVKPARQPQISQDIELTVCWLNETPLVLGAKYIVKHTTREVRCIVKEIQSKLNVTSLNQSKDKVANLELNDIGKIKIRTANPLFFDSYHSNRETGSLILINEFTNETVGAGMIV
ncbi:sulfate adenylyltransferase subunit 1 [Candidatus Nitrosacidococcus tergens]|uniref:sulfate adenylyltransferase n=1 Tax=Candidatus Nitrosacidococcus tergens TaxID=553981 RepID=A0A7G1Q8A2_9GAMM|nr:GTP-binding protein [Candidatus Nitrosacidococcus tergens]CAB1274869.1 Sulfate adenylyltransferase, large subunit [Candidatus Nitrosacidococcus tergens]